MRNNVRKGWSPVSKIIFTLAACTFVFAAYRIISIQLEYKRGNDEYAEIGTSYIKQNDQEPGIMDRLETFRAEGEASGLINNSGIEVDFGALTAENPDVVGWIHFPGMELSYPIMQGKDNDYYLNHTFKKERNKNGSIYIDRLNNASFEDDNTLIYGHNMKSGAMFGQLKKYKDKDFFKENPYFYILKPDGSADKYEIFAYYTTDSLDSYVISFGNESQHIKYLDMVKEKAAYDTGVEVTDADGLATLITCEEGRTSEYTRFVVHGRRAGR